MTLARVPYGALGGGRQEPGAGPPGRGRQHGFVLLVCLALLTAVALLAWSAMRGAIFDQRVAAAHQHRHMAFQAAENALTRLLHADPAVAPAPQPGASVILPGFGDDDRRRSATEDPAGVATELTIEYRGTLERVFVSGFAVQSTGLVYRVTATGTVATSGASVTNRMGVVVISAP